MATVWRTRREELEYLLPDIRQDLRAELSPQDRQAANILRCLNSDHPGELLDLLDYHVHREEHTPSRLDRTFQKTAELQLSYKRDFTVVHTLAEEPSIGTAVSVVVSRGLGTSRRVYAAKSITKSAALKLEGQTSAFHERDILFQARQSRVQHAPWLIAAEHDTTHLHILLQYLPSGDIGLLLSERKVLPLRWVRFWAAEATQAIIWLHELGYAHRDIKPANILLDTSGHAKLADFASAGPLISSSSDAATVMKKYCLAPVGTVDYIAPDILLAHERAVMESDEDDEDEAEESLNGPGPYDASVDFWSLGVTIYEMLVGSLPFYADSIPETYERILQHEIHLDWEALRLDTAAKNLLQSLITKPELRLVKESLAKHPFFADIVWDDIRDMTAPFRPPIRSLDAKVGQTSREDFSRGFDFSALFSSPGLSVLRPVTSDEPDQRWLGFTFVPTMEEFEKRVEDVEKEGLLLSVNGSKTIPSKFPTTPARSSATPPSNIHSSNRHRQKAVALQEVVTYGILKTAKKASAARRIVSADEQGSPLCKRLPELERRHSDLMSRITSIESRYNDLANTTERLR